MESTNPPTELQESLPGAPSLAEYQLDHGTWSNDWNWSQLHEGIDASIVQLVFSIGKVGIELHTQHVLNAWHHSPYRYRLVVELSLWVGGYV
ncbi:hypothetical protein L917_03113 [Phytophthora nicotianae]|uniref:Uncharacterized protein n=1 Tax=Phytophthora nicotianae TaxID=4792 RepID=W2LRX9_PHYNI|nr:hypothetical protein L917_03113 [Phytophthora nicotianae]